MLDNPALEVVIGLTFVYLLYSLLGTLLQELIATKIGLRGLILRKAIRRMLDDGRKDKSLSNAFYGHPLIRYLAADNWWRFNSIPAYLTHDSFSKVVIDLLRGTDLQAGDVYNTLIQKSLNDAKAAWDPKPAISGETLKYLRSLWIDAQGDVQKFKLLLEQWFDEMMDRTTGWYKQWTQFILLLVGLFIAVVFNVDTLKVVDKLEHDPKLRAQVISQANDYVKAHPAAAKPDAKGPEKAVQDALVTQSVTMVQGDIAKTNKVLSLGWDGGFLTNDKCVNVNGRSWLGWLLTALAISLGAPFWFDLLNKLMKLRSSVNSGKKEQDAAKKKTAVIPATERVG